MFQTQRKNNDFDIHILNKLSEDLRNAITNSTLSYHTRIASTLNQNLSHLLMVKRFC